MSLKLHISQFIAKGKTLTGFHCRAFSGRSCLVKYCGANDTNLKRHFEFPHFSVIDHTAKIRHEIRSEQKAAGPAEEFLTTKL